MNGVTTNRDDARYNQSLTTRLDNLSIVESTMSVARVTEIISSSKKSFEHAIEDGVERACKTLDNVKSAWVKDQKVEIEDGKIKAYRVTMMVTFVLKD